MFNRPHHQPATARQPSSSGHPAQKPAITLMTYDAETYEERTVDRIEELFIPRQPGKVTWINIDGLGDVEMLDKLGEHFGLHPLALEDVLHTTQRPKIEEYEHHYFMVVQMVYPGGSLEVQFEQVSIFFGADFLITIQEEPMRDVFEPVRARLRGGRGFSRSRGHDYLAYALLDAVIDHFFPVLEALGEAVEELEDELLERPSRESVRRLHELKRTLLSLRRNAWPTRELVGSLMRNESALIKSETKVFLRDCYDHTVQTMDVIENYRDLSTSMMDIYLSSLGMRTNEIMRVLTVISSIFIPLTFIAGVYGMNFDYMPELKMHNGYFACLGVMLALALGMVAFFRRKGWL